ncbi:MAG: class I SAM-dependent RNA methyltransferase [Pseudomonadota bacterium]
MTQEVTIASLGARGDGITDDGLYVPFTVPGDRAIVDPQGDRARLVQLLALGPERAEPLCPHFTQCGGCVVQHYADAAVADWKTGIITASLASRGISGVEIRPMITSPPASRRRVALSARRTKKTIQIGFHAPGSDRIVPISACAVARPELVACLPRLEELISIGASRKGEIRLALTLTEGGVDVAISGAKEMSGPERALLSGAANRAGIARLTWNGDVALTRSPPTVRLGRARATLPPGGFLQATAEGEAALVAAVREAVGDARRIVDLYAGVGTFTLPLAEQASVRAFEGSGPAVAALDTAWRGAEGLREVTSEKRDLAMRPLLARDFKDIEAVVIDPPRAGALRQTENLATSGVPRITAVSCNPATFARDARVLLDAGYTLDWIQPVDQFRWSAHTELAAQFTRLGS